MLLKFLLCLGWGLWALEGLAQRADSLGTRPAQLTDTWVVGSRTTDDGECTEMLKYDSLRGIVRVYYPAGQLKSYLAFRDAARLVPFGVATTWYENGQLWTSQEYQRGQRHGTLLVYYPDGALKRRTTYVDGRELIGSCFDPTGQPLPYSVYELPPLYPGGAARLEKDVSRQLRAHLPRGRPNSVYDWLLTQRVEVVFQVAADGSVQNPRLLGDTVVGLLPELAAQVLKAVRQLPQSFRPGWLDGQAVASYYLLSVSLGGY